MQVKCVCERLRARHVVELVTMSSPLVAIGIDGGNWIKIAHSPV